MTFNLESLVLPDSQVHPFYTSPFRPIFGDVRRYSAMFGDIIRASIHDRDRVGLSWKTKRSWWVAIRSLIRIVMHDLPPLGLCVAPRYRSMRLRRVHPELGGMEQSSMALPSTSGACPEIRIVGKPLHSLIITRPRCKESPRLTTRPQALHHLNLRFDPILESFQGLSNPHNALLSRPYPSTIPTEHSPDVDVVSTPSPPGPPHPPPSPCTSSTNPPWPAPTPLTPSQPRNFTPSLPPLSQPSSSLPPSLKYRPRPPKDRPPWASH